MFFCEIYKICKTIYFVKYLRTAASVFLEENHLDDYKMIILKQCCMTTFDVKQSIYHLLQMLNLNYLTVAFYKFNQSVS